MSQQKGKVEVKYGIPELRNRRKKGEQSEEEILIIKSMENIEHILKK